jgi:hypothetical protein
MGTAVYTPEDFDDVIQAVASGESMSIGIGGALKADLVGFPGRMDPKFLITSRIALSQLVSHGILKLLHDPGSDIKILVDLSKSENS